MLQRERGKKHHNQILSISPPDLTLFFPLFFLFFVLVFGIGLSQHFRGKESTIVCVFSAKNRIPFKFDLSFS